MNKQEVINAICNLKINDGWVNRDEYRLTESEIRKDFDWAWKEGFAKEVEND